MRTVEEFVEELSKLEPLVAKAAAEHKEVYDGLDLPVGLLGDLADPLVPLLAEMTDERRSRIYDLVESALEQGDEMLGTSVTTGFLEALLHLTEWQKRDVSFIWDKAGPLALDYLKAWDNFYNPGRHGV